MWPVTSHVYKRATEPLLPAGRICTQLNGRNKKILYFMEIALSNLYKLLMMKKGDTCQNLVQLIYFHNSWIYVEIMTRNVNFLMWPGPNFIEMLSTTICLAWNFFLDKNWITNQFPFVAYCLWLIFSCSLLILKITWTFGWKFCFYQGKNVMLSNFLCLAALWNWAKYSFLPARLAQECTKITWSLAKNNKYDYKRYRYYYLGIWLT